MDNQEIIGVDEVAALLKSEAETIMQFARTGEIPGAKIGKSWIFIKSDVLAFLRERIDTATALRRRAAASPSMLGYIVSKPAHGRSSPRPVLPDMPR